LLRYPEGDDVVVGFVRRGNLDQFHMPLAPVANRLDPAAGSQFVAVVQFLVTAEIAGALQQTEAPRILDAVAADGQALGVVQRTPDPFAVAGMDRQAFGVMQLWPVVELLAGLISTEQVHAGERRDAELLHRRTQEDLGLYVHDAVLARRDFHTVGTGGTR